MKASDQNTNRRLAAIMHADIVGFSAMMGADESGTHSLVKDAIERCAAIAAQYEGRIVSTAGDSFLAEFPSIVQAVHAALEIQRGALPGSEQEPARRILFRVGINIGDVISDQDDIFGDGVNVAARVQAVSPPGGIAITGAAYDQLGNRAGVNFVDTGKQNLKNIGSAVRVYIAKPPFEDQPVAVDAPARLTWVLRFFRPGPVIVGCVLFLTAMILAFALSKQWPNKSDSDGDIFQSQQRPVLAVLPFTELGATEETAYFAEGFTEDMIVDLGRFSQIIVLSWNAVAPYKDRVADISEIHRSLNARYVIGGTIRRQDEKIRLSVQLTDARNGNLLWAQQFEGTSKDLFALQDEIAGTAAGALALGVEKQEQKSALSQPTQTMTAYDLVLRGRYTMRRVDREANIEARDLFERAVALDPQYADALAELAWTHVNDVWWGWSEWPENAIMKGETLARRALNFSPDNVNALSALAELHWMKNDLQSAQEYCKSAVQGNPNDSKAHASCAGVLTFSGEIDEGIAHGELTLRLDPEPSTWLFTNLAIGYYFKGRFEDAIGLLKRSANFIDEDPAPHAVMAAAYAKLGRDDLAAQQVEATLRLYPFFEAKIFAGNLVASGFSQELLDGLRAAGFD